MARTRRSPVTLDSAVPTDMTAVFRRIERVSSPPVGVGVTTSAEVGTSFPTTP